MGARFDGAIDPDTDHYVTNGLGIPRLSANDPDTAANELRAYLVATGTAEDGEGMFSMGDLLGSGMASSEGKRFVDEAVKSIEKVRADVAALLALDSKPTGLNTILEGQWANLEMALDDIFGTTSNANPDTATVTSAVRTTAPREEDILDEIDDILDALSSEASFVAATAEDGGGVFDDEDGHLGAGAAADAFNRLMWSAEATLGVTGSTRYGTAQRNTSADAKSKPTSDVFGAFSYATMEQTVRTVDAAAVSLTGIASYSGGTRAVSGSGKTYSGQMDLQVRFTANSVSGVVSGLEDSDGLAWQHNFADVDRIVLDDANLQRNARWSNTTGSDATVFYTADSGLLRPVRGISNTFQGILLGQGADAGSEANGVWSVGTSGTGYLTGGFGVVHVADAARPTPSGDDGSASTAVLFSMVADTENNDSSATIADGMLTVKTRSYGWAGRSGTTAPTYQPLTDNNGTPEDVSDDSNVLVSAKFDLAALAASGAQTMNGPKWADGVVATLERERDLLATLQGLSSGDTQAAELAAWQRVQDAVQFQIFGGLLPVKLDDPYAELESEADAIDLINRALDALSSNANLEAALDPDGTGIFDHFDTDTGAEGVQEGNFRYYDSVDRRNEVVTVATATDATTFQFDGTPRNGRTIAQVRGEREYKVISALGTTDFTRFGFWRRESTTSARRNDGQVGHVIRAHGGPGTFAYSPLDPTNAGTPTNPGFPRGGNATYTGETVAIMNATILTGTVQVDVSWGAATDTDDNGIIDAGAASVGSMALTISDLASAAGDPLTNGGSAEDGSEAPGTEIADIVLGALTINVGQAGDNVNDLIVGTAVTTDPTAVTYTEANPGNARLRFDSLGTVDDTGVPATTAASVKALFVGQGVDGPLGVIGTWTVQAGTIGLLNATGTEPIELGTSIYGAFGAEIP